MKEVVDENAAWRRGSCLRMRRGTSSQVLDLSVDQAPMSPSGVASLSTRSDTDDPKRGDDMSCAVTI